MKLNKNILLNTVVGLGLVISTSSLYGFDYEEPVKPAKVKKVVTEEIGFDPLGNTSSVDIVGNVEIVDNGAYKKKKFKEIRNHIISGAKHCKAVGNTLCLEEFNKRKSDFVKGNKYIWAIDFEGNMLAHPKKRIKGKSFWDYEDKEGNLMYQNFIITAKNKGYGWVDFSWSHPQTGGIIKKTAFVITIGDEKLIGLDIYK